MSRSKLACSFAAAFAALAVRAPAAADLVEKTGRFGGLELRYKVLLPPTFESL